MTDLDPKSAAAVSQLERFERIGAGQGLGKTIEDAVRAPLRCQSLEALYEHFADEAYAFLTAFLGEQALALEVLEETFFRANLTLRKTGASLGLADVLRFARESGLEARRLLDKARESDDEGTLLVVPTTRALLLERTGLGLLPVELAETHGTSPGEVDLALRAAAKELARALVPPAHEGGEGQLELLTRRAAGLATEAEVRALTEHLDGCPVCAVLAERLREACEVPLVAVEEHEATWMRIEQRIDRVRAHHEAVARAALKVSLGCCFCHDTVRREESVYCASCLAPHHADCFAEHGRCSAPGCHEEHSVRPGAKPEPKPRRSLRVPNWVWAGIGGGLVAAAAFSAGWNGGSSSTVDTRQQWTKAQEWPGQATQTFTVGEILMTDSPPRVVYGGESVEQWVAKLYDYSPSVRTEAVNALSKMGRAAVPALIDALDNPEDGVRQAAADALARMRPEQAADAIPALIHAIRSKDSRGALRGSAVHALGNMQSAGAPAVEALALALSDPAEDVRWRAANALSMIGEASSPATDALIVALADPKAAAVREQAAEALAAIGPRAAKATHALSVALADEDAGTREVAAKALGVIGPNARAATPALRRALFDDSENVVAAAVEALGEIDAEANIPNLLASLSGERLSLESTVVKVLVKLGIKAVPPAIEALKSSNYSIRSGASSALGRIGVKDKRAVKLLIEAYQETGSSELRAVLQRIDPLRNWDLATPQATEPPNPHGAEASGKPRPKR